MPMGGGNNNSSAYVLQTLVTKTTTSSSAATILNTKNNANPLAIAFSTSTANTPNGSIVVTINGVSYTATKSNMAQNIVYYVSLNPLIATQLQPDTTPVPLLPFGSANVDTFKVEGYITGGYTLTVKVLYQVRV